MKQFQIYAPLEARTKNSILILWDKINITDFGASCGEGVVNTGAIQKAIDSCTAGGTVYIPAGVFYTGALYLHSNMTLELAEGAKLIGTGKQ